MSVDMKNGTSDLKGGFMKRTNSVKVLAFPGQLAVTIPQDRRNAVVVKWGSLANQECTTTRKQAADVIRAYRKAVRGLLDRCEESGGVCFSHQQPMGLCRLGE